MKTITIHVEPDYEVLVGRGVLDTLGELAAKVVQGRVAALITDDVVDGLYGQKAQEALRQGGFEVCRYVFPHGEPSKNLDTWGKILCFLADQKLGRSDVVIALGGGVAGDMAGFAAAVYLRGISCIQVPTTLLAAIDSSVGGKTAVDLPQGKNLAGTFHQPSLVVCDPDTLTTLPPEILADGMAEAIKTAVIGDRELLDLLSRQSIGIRQWEEIILRCVEVKRQMVERDVLDNSDRQLLNLGHTMAHGIEKLSGYQISHGHAVAMGTAAITKAAAKLGVCSPRCAEDILTALKARGLATDIAYSAKDLAEAAASDKKRRGGFITLVLPKEVGECILYPVKISELAHIFALGLEESTWK